MPYSLNITLNPFYYPTVDEFFVYVRYGQMTAGSYVYIGPQGIVHGTTVTSIKSFLLASYSLILVENITAKIECQFLFSVYYFKRKEIYKTT